MGWLNGLRRAIMAATIAWAGAANAEPVQLNVIGGLGNVSQYTRFEEPFWTREIATLSRGRLTARIHAFDQAGLRAQEMLHLMQTGVVPLGTILVSLAGEEPELNALDLAGLNPDFASLRRTANALRPRIATLLAEKYGLELLSIYIYPAQVVFCKKPFHQLSDLSGRRIRTSAIGQSELFSAIGAIPVQTAFSETVPVIVKGLADCAVTGTLSGNQIGLHDVTSHIHGMAITWGVSVFAAHAAFWHAIPDDLQAVLRAGIADLEHRIWDSAEAETRAGMACNLGQPTCTTGRRGQMRLVPAAPEDEALRRRLLVDTVLPRWIARCGANCARTWNEILAEPTGIAVVEPQDGGPVRAVPVPAPIR
ncbi:ABC transporter substrate-binding protein [Prosthecomicrobium hirschii]|uniref:ABC transporter substrate-binding protein n=1 Tax=Prosthecodimorpha hirschii TaxID=665126 RepID=A0A0P6VJP3_9HYPH|nr:TRAP transporter substrate-binding protein [Prosthecomicrobium hirschii]KPL52730.1 ABC transporter substrate-binding protein [Prosthecomicrobium hirschii]